jgi:zinc protease
MIAFVSAEAFDQEVLKSELPVLVDFVADWCQPCKAMAPALEQAAVELAGKVKVVKLDADKDAKLSERYAVRSLPTLMMFRGGKLATRVSGAMVQKPKLMAWIDEALAAVPEEPRQLTVSDFTLANGMQVVVVTDSRAPQIAHDLWYKAGSADAPAGASGVATLLQKMIFSSDEEKQASAVLMGAVNGLAADVHGPKDVTAFRQRVAKEQLIAAMQVEARRMTSVEVIESRFLSTREALRAHHEKIWEVAPAVELGEQIDLALFGSHPYRTPLMGLEHEVAELSKEHLEQFHGRYYAPNNAVLVVCGNVTAQEVRRLAEEAYGAVPARPVAEKRDSSKELPQASVRHLITKSSRASRLSLRRVYCVPSYASAVSGEATALHILSKILGNGKDSRLAQFVRDKKANRSAALYIGSDVDCGTLTLALSEIDAADREAMETMEAGLDAVLADIRANGVTETELAAAKSSVLPDMTFDTAAADKLAIRYGAGLATGRTLAQVQSWPDEVAKVTVDDIKNVAKACLDPARAVTGWLVPDNGESADNRAA